MSGLNADSSLHDLLEEYPFLVDFLPTVNPKFGMLKNPEMRATAARFATLEMAAGMGGVELDTLIQAIDGEIRRVVTESGTEETTAEDMEAGENASAPLPEKTQALKSIILELHDGLPAEEARIEDDVVVPG